MFLPRIQLEIMRKGKKVDVAEPLFPGYLFVNIRLRTTDGQYAFSSWRKAVIKLRN